MVVGFAVVAFCRILIGADPDVVLHDLPFVYHAEEVFQRGIFVNLGSLVVEMLLSVLYCSVRKNEKQLV